MNGFSTTIQEGKQPQIMRALSVTFQIPLLSDNELYALENITDAEEAGCDGITAWVKYDLDYSDTVRGKQGQVQDFLANKEKYTADIEQSCKC